MSSTDELPVGEFNFLGKIMNAAQRACWLTCALLPFASHMERARVHGARNVPCGGPHSKACAAAAGRGETARDCGGGLALRHPPVGTGMAAG